MGCIHERDVQKYADIPKEVVTKNLQWAEYALPKINDLKPNSYVLEGMKLVKDIEDETKDKRRASKQMEHLVAIANHEQEMILQKLIYENSNFVHWIRQQRKYWLLNLFSPAYELIFTADCKTDDAALKSEAPEDLELELLGSLDDGADSKTRMGWIGVAAEKFHGLMQHHELSVSMDVEIQTMASWVNEGDGFNIYFHPSSFE